jgi:hypothetical protein
MDRKDGTEALTQFTWERQPEAERLVRELVEDFLRRSQEAANLAARMKTETGTRFVDWVDHISPEFDAAFEQRLIAAGYKRHTEEHEYVWRQPQGVFPPILQREGRIFQIAIKVESLADFAAANGLSLASVGIGNDVQGAPFSPFRKIESRGATSFAAVERHGDRGFRHVEFPPEKSVLWLEHLERFRTRQRGWNSDEPMFFNEAESLIDSAIADLGPDLTCDLFFAAEREYWQRRNRAAQFQKARQDRLGLGWANHDHHTYRSSRKHFSRLIGLWEKLGFQLRERFYAGAEAGWGAQVCEQPNTGIITFNDVDLSPEELLNDFSHNPLPERHDLGTVGLWCALHGESFLQAGMHHLECQFDFDSLKEQMEREANIKVMKPFTDYPYLRQAFTEGERWPVKEERLAALLKNGQITQEQAQKFREQGAIGSHLENLERNEGFKGFNQKGVSEIIAKTDPRKNV